MKVDSNATSAQSSASAQLSEKSRKLAEGLSLSEANLNGAQSWSYSLFWGAERGMIEFQDAWDSELGVEVSYRLGENSALSASVGYQSILYQPGGSHFLVAQDTDPDRYGLSDFTLSYVRPSVWKNENGRLMWTNSLVLPTSEISNRASLNVDWDSSLLFRYNLTSRFLVTPVVGAYVRSYRFEEANAFGTKINSPLGGKYGLGLAYVVTRWLVLSTSYSQTQRYDYRSRWTSIQVANAQASVTVTDSINARLGYVWRDQIITNEPLFADDRSLVNAGLIYAF